MGGHHSKLTPEAEAMPPKIRPLLQRKYEEIKARIRARKLKTHVAPSRKELLKPENNNEEEEDTNEFESLHYSSPDRNVTSLKVQTVLEKKSSNVAPVLVDHDEIKDKKNEEYKSSDNSIKEHKEKESVKAAKDVPVYIGGVFALEQATDGEEENEDQEDMRSINYEIGGSSPSFRVYCQDEQTAFEELERQTDKDASIREDDSMNSRDEEENHQKTPSASSSVDSIPHNNDQDTKTKKKSKRRRMKNPFHMGGVADCSVKNLLNVRGCAGSGAGHDRQMLLEEKSAAT